VIYQAILFGRGQLPLPRLRGAAAADIPTPAPPDSEVLRTFYRWTIMAPSSLPPKDMVLSPTTAPLIFEPGKLEKEIMRLVHGPGLGPGVRFCHPAVDESEWQTAFSRQTATKQAYVASVAAVARAQERLEEAICSSMGVVAGRGRDADIEKLELEVLRDCESLHGKLLALPWERMQTHPEVGRGGSLDLLLAARFCLQSAAERRDELERHMAASAGKGSDVLLMSYLVNLASKKMEAKRVEMEAAAREAETWWLRLRPRPAF
jgi:hypothetical protein